MVSAQRAGHPRRIAPRYGLLLLSAHAISRRIPSAIPICASQAKSRLAFSGEKPSLALVVVCTLLGSWVCCGLSDDFVNFNRMSAIWLTDVSTPVAIRRLSAHTSL